MIPHSSQLQRLIQGSDHIEGIVTFWIRGQEYHRETRSAFAKLTEREESILLEGPTPSLQINISPHVTPGVYSTQRKNGDNNDINNNDGNIGFKERF